jgi:protein-disulfide isomerase
METHTPVTPPTRTPIDPALRQSIFTSVAILLAGAFVAGAILYNGAHSSGTVAAGATQPSPTTKPADISKVNISGEPYIGKVDAPVTIAYWSDYQCPFCQRHEQQVVSQIVKNYVDTGKVKIVFKDYSFLGADSQFLAKYGRAVWEAAPDKFYAWHKAMFDNQGKENTGWATKAKIDEISTPVLGVALMAKVDSLVVSKGAEYQKLMDADKAEGTAMGVSGTPGTIIGKVLIPGAYPYATFQTAIETALK